MDVPTSRTATRHPFWLVCEGPGRPLTLRLAGVGEALPVFSFEEEAELFLCLAGETDGASVERMRGGELGDLISALPPGVRHVALDPPGTDGALVGLVSLGRRDFLRFLHAKIGAPTRS